jgi:hypothetical protein
MTEWIYVDRTKYADDGCDWTPAILWQMNASARARSRAVYIPAPRPVQVAKPSAPMIRRTPVAATPGDKTRKRSRKHILASSFIREAKKSYVCMKRRRPGQ